MKTRIRRLVLVFTGCFLVLAFYLSYVHLFSPVGKIGVNSRAWLREKNTIRGKILDHHGVILAETKNGQRIYPLGEAAAHVVGYVSDRFGKSGLELHYDRELSGFLGSTGVKNTFRVMTGRRAEGNDIFLSLDASVQRLAYQLLCKAGSGGIVVIEPRTGKILAAVSSPSFSPDRPEPLWADRDRMQKESSLLNRAFQGLYCPGSIFKIITGMVARPDEIYHCPGYINVSGRKIDCISAHGTVDFGQAMAYSCNTAFITMALEAGPEKMLRAAESMGFNRAIPFDLPVAQGQFPSAVGETPDILAQSAVGQGTVLATPLLMALVTCAVANDGVMMRPYLVSGVQGPDGGMIKSYIPRKWLIPLEKQEADFLKQAMEQTIKSGTGKKAAIAGVAVAGKTGTAQVTGKPSHAWFVGFAPGSDPQVALAVVVENGGVGGDVAAPIGRELIKGILDL